MFPVRCFTCGKCIGAKELAYNKLLEKGKHPGEALDSIGMTRFCCRRMFLTHVDLISHVILYENDKDSKPEKNPETEKKKKF